MNEHDKNLQEKLGVLLALARAESSPLPTPDPDLPARIRAMPSALSKGATTRQRPRRRVWTSLAAAALVLAAGMGAYVGYGAASRSLTDQQANDANAFLTAISQSGFGDDMSRLHREVYE